MSKHQYYNENVLPIYIILKNENKELSQKSNEDFWLIFCIQVKFVILQSYKATVSEVFKYGVMGNKVAFISLVGSL